MENQQPKVLACIDGASLTEAVCDYAAWIAQRVDAPLKLLHTIDHHQETAVSADLTGNIGLGSQEHLLETIIELEQQQSKLKLHKGKLMLKAAKERVKQAGIVEPICNQRHGGLIESLIELEDSIRVLVLGLRGQVHDNRSDQIGAKLEAIIRSLHRPILVVNDHFKTPHRMMIAYDGSKAADKAVDMVAASALYRGMSCHLVCVNKNEETAAKLLEQASTRLKTNGDIEVTTVKLQGKVEQELCAYQQQHDIDLTVMGAFSHTRLRDMLLGSFTHKMLLKTQKPLLLLR
ncbi:universal stress protein [Methylomarinum vadi]|uniref:universal stress protein n=1 Tax=Methylomarinum vadi TaxID=438855 RepID=UPI0004DF4E1E|nr:universal stress protein [Methylomarinum vadi]